MIARTTTTGSLKTYRYNLQRSGFNMNNSMNTMLTGRVFNSFAEDPSSAALSFQKRRALLRNSSQRSLNSSTQYKFQQAWKAMDQIESNLDTVSGSATFKELMLRGENGPDASARNALGQSMKALAENMVQTMNGRYGENFIFAGADGLNVPFTWGSTKNPDYVADPDAIEHFQYLMDDGTGTNTLVGTNDPTQADYEPNPIYDPAITDANDPKSIKYVDKNGGLTNDPNDAAPRKNPAYNENASFQFLTKDGEPTNDEREAGRTLFYRGAAVNSNDEKDLKLLDYYSKEETKYVDIGLGYDTIGGKVESTSVFDCALQGVDFLGGYGLDEDGDPKNVIAMVDRMGDILKNCSSEDGDFASTPEGEEFYRLAYKYEKISSGIKDKYVELDTKSSFLTTNATILETAQYNLQEEITVLEDVDEAQAISDFIFAKYTYDTALKVGNSILAQSLMDYLNL